MMRNCIDINKNKINEDEYSKKPQIFVDHLLRITGEGGTQFTESEVRDHVFTTISAVSYLKYFILKKCVIVICM